MEHIFKNLPKENRLKLRLVCKEWKNIFEASPLLSKDLNLKLTGWTIKNQNAKFFNNHTSNFYQLTVNQLEYDELPDAAWKQMCSTIQVLTIIYCYKMSLSNFNKLLNYCKNLKHIQIYDHFPPLGPGYQTETFLHFNWNVRNVSKFEMFRAIAVDNEKVTHFMRNMKTLRHLWIETSYIQQMNSSIIDVVKMHSKNITSLYLVDNESDSFKSVSLPNLTILSSLCNIELVVTKFGYRLAALEITQQLSKWFKKQQHLQLIEFWTEQDFVHVSFLNQLFTMLPELNELIIHYDHFKMSYKRNQINAYHKRKLNYVRFFTS